MKEYLKGDDEIMSNDYSTGSSAAIPYGTNSTPQGMRVSVETTPQREVDKALEALGSDLMLLSQEISVLQGRLSSVLSISPQACGTGSPDAVASGYSCALASSLEAKQDAVKHMRQMVNGILSDLQL